MGIRTFTVLSPLFTLIVEVVEAEFPAYLSLEQVYHEVQDFKAPGVRQTAAEARSPSPEEELSNADLPLPQSNNAAARQALAIIQGRNQPTRINVKAPNTTPATPQHFNMFVKRPLDSDLEEDAAPSPYRQVPRNKKIKSEPMLDAAKEERNLKHQQAMAKIALEELRLKVRDGQLKQEAEEWRTEAQNASQMIGMLGDIIKALVPTVAKNSFAVNNEPVDEPVGEDQSS